MKKITTWYKGLNIYLQLLPFLLLYMSICIFFPKDINLGDQKRYLMFADNLLNGYYSPAYPQINLWNGPGYPILLFVFQFLKFNYIALRLLNALMLYASLILTYKTIGFYSSKKNALYFTLALALYFPIFESVRQLLTETLAWFLISLICFLFSKNFQQSKRSWKLVLATGVSIAFLAMTKIIFGYVILAMIFVSLFFFLFPKFRATAMRSAVIFIVSLALCLPYLAYTYSITHKAFYWSNSGSMSLYTMSTPYVGETGQWYDEGDLLKNTNHNHFMDSISKLDPLEKDAAYKNAGIKNIKQHPGKYLINIVSNVGRLLFFPSDYAPDSIFSYYPFVPNMFIVVFIVISILVSLKYYKKIPKELIYLFMFIAIYLVASTMVSAYRRMFHITMPFWFIIFPYILSNIITIKVKEDL